MANPLDQLHKLSQSKTVRIVGMMTGTSADGLDLCLVEFVGTDRFPQFKVLSSAGQTLPAHFAAAFKKPLALTLSEATELSFALGKWYAEQVVQTGWDFDLIASHGQTLVHAPPKYTLQIGEPGYLAEKSGKPVIYDFRSRDVVLGGQGAPLIPIVDEYLFRDRNESRLCLNIGGIANVTLLPPRDHSLPVIAWDTGPGNTLLDRAIVTWTEGVELFDINGKNAGKGSVNQPLLTWLLSHPFCQKLPPKSAGQEEFGLSYFEQIIKRFQPQSDQDWQNLLATLTEFTVTTIINEIQRMGSGYPQFDRMFLSGGGSRNDYLMGRLKSHLPDVIMETVNLAGITTDNKEAFGFAYLGYLWLRQLSGNLPAVTGAKHATILGKLCF